MSETWCDQVSRARCAVARCAVVAAALCVSGCGERTLPSAPAAVTTGIAVYSDINEDGASAHITADIHDLRALASACAEIDTQNDSRFTAGSHTWTNCISSLGVHPGWRAILYANPGFAGARVELTDRVRDLRLIPGPCLGTLKRLRVLDPGRQRHGFGVRGDRTDIPVSADTRRGTCVSA